ncbi:uncharacterized protein LOC142804234 isoform X2 [Rhipicephalus microplus]|uniref:uncharacterized protein LOC142804234 isoform X2 n=1 Tax=Rhipicephalus microplus TaxID=6941 RepID=UPI003F6CDB90
MCHGCRCAEVVFGCALNNNLRSIHTCTNKSSNAVIMYQLPKRKKRGPYKRYINHGSDFVLPRSTERGCQQREVPMDTSSSDDEAAGQASVSTDINGILRTDTLSSEDEQETSSDACSTAASRVTSAPVSPTTPELQATNDRPQHANPMVSHDTLLNDEELSMSDEDGSEQHDPGELPSEDDMQMPNSPTGPSHGGKSQFGELFTDVITERVVLSRGDILLMVLKHAVKNNLSFTGLTSMLDLINRIFEHPILPDSRYQLSKLLSKTGTTMTYYCFCPKCFTHIENAETNASFQCIQCGHRTSVSSLSDMPFFVTLDVESQLQRLLKANFTEIH